MAEGELRPEEGQDCAGVAELGAHDTRADGFLGLVGEEDEFEEVFPGLGRTTIFGISPYDRSISSILPSSGCVGISFVWSDARIWTPP